MKVLAGDIGGTNTRLGLFDCSGQTPKLCHLEVLSSQEFGSFDELLGKLLPQSYPDISAVCLGVAGPVAHGRCKTPNLPWELDERQLRQHFSLPEVRLLNDLQANAEGIALLEPSDLFLLQAGRLEETIDSISENRCLVSCGTGLGVAGLVPSSGKWLSIASEGGHVDFSARSPIETDLQKWLQRRHGHVSYERILSGPGLANIYHYLVDKEGTAPRPEIGSSPKPAALISALGLTGEDKVCAHALRIFTSTLGAFAGNVALQYLSTGGLYLGGGIAPQILPALQSEEFLKAFLDKGRMRQLLSEVPIFVIKNELTALMGAATVARSMVSESTKAVTA